MRQDVDEKKEVKLYCSVSEAAKRVGCSPQALYFAITNNRVFAIKINGRWQIDIYSLYSYIQNRWSRRLSRFDNAPLFDVSKGEISIEETSQKIGLTYSQVYYALKKNYIPHVRKRKSYILNVKDIEKIKKTKWHYL